MGQWVEGDAGRTDEEAVAALEVLGRVKKRCERMSLSEARRSGSSTRMDRTNEAASFGQGERSWRQPYVQSSRKEKKSLERAGGARKKEKRTWVEPTRDLILTVEDELPHDAFVVVVERERAGQERKQDHAERPDVDLWFRGKSRGVSTERGDWEGGTITGAHLLRGIVGRRRLRGPCSRGFRRGCP